MNLVCEYFKEREKMECIADEKSFINYQIEGENCYSRDCFVLPEFRREKIATKLVDQVAEIASKAGCKLLWGSVSLKAENNSESMQAMLYYGFKLSHSSGEMIYLKKELAPWVE